MSDETKINRTHKHVVGFMSDTKPCYLVCFIVNFDTDDKEAEAIDKTIPDVLNPEEYDRLRCCWDNMTGGFVKDGIKVYTWWDILFEYFWEIYSVDEAMHKKVYEWAAMVYDEYSKLKNQ